MLGGIAEGLLVQDTQGDWVYANDVAAQLCGFASAEAMLDGSVDATLSRFALLDENGQPLPVGRLPARQVLTGKAFAEALVGFRSSGTRQERWSIVTARPIHDDSGQLQLVVSIFREITERKRAQDAAAFVAAASRLLAESLDLEVTLQHVANLAVPTLADWCVVDLAEAREIRRIAIAHVDPSRVAVARELQERYPDDPRASVGVSHVLRTGQPELLEEITDEMIQAGARDSEHLRLLRELQLRSYLIVPMVARDRTLGAITLAAAESGRNYSAPDLSLAEDLASRAALALDNARLYQEAQQQADAQVLLNAALRDLISERNEAVRRLEEVLQERDAFLAAAAHDLKNPLAGIKGTVQLLERRVQSNRPPDAQQLATALSRISRTVSGAVGQVEELLDLTRLQMGQSLELDLAPADVVALIRDVVANHEQFSTRHLLRLEANPPQITGEWDPRRLSRVVANLLDNAVRYSPDGGDIVVRLGMEDEDQGRSVVITVKDSGIGIPPDDLPRIFERFHRASNVRGRIAGTGVGLASARSIVQAHGGTIHVESVEGSGSTFTIRLPIAVGAAQTLI